MILPLETFKAICYDYADNAHTIKEACKSRGTSWESFRQTRDSSPEMLKLYERCRLDKAEFEFDDSAEMADQGLREVKACKDKNANAIAAMWREKIALKKWRMGKIVPQKYGDKVDVTSGGKALQDIPATMTVRIAKD